MDSPDIVNHSPAWNEDDLCALVTQVQRDLHPDGTAAAARAAMSSSLDRDLGFDSLSRMELLLLIEGATGLGLPENTLEIAETGGDLWQAVQRGRMRPSLETPVARARPSASATPAHPGYGWSTQARTLLEVLDDHVAAHPEQVQIVYLAEELNHTATSAGCWSVAASSSEGLGGGLDEGARATAANRKSRPRPPAHHM